MRTMRMWLVGHCGGAGAAEGPGSGRGALSLLSLCSRWERNVVTSDMCPVNSVVCVCVCCPRGVVDRG